MQMVHWQKVDGSNPLLEYQRQTRGQRDNQQIVSVENHPGNLLPKIPKVCVSSITQPPLNG